MKTLIITILFLSACASQREIVRRSNVNMRVFVTSDISERDTNEAEAALVTSGYFRVVSRGRAFNALIGEQNSSNNESKERFSDKERFSVSGKLLSVGSVVSVSQSKDLFNGFFGQFYKCRQQISLVDSSTSEVIAHVSNTIEQEPGEYNAPCSWTETVDKFVSSIDFNSEVFDNSHYSQRREEISRKQ